MNQWYQHLTNPDIIGLTMTSGLGHQLQVGIRSLSRQKSDMEDELSRKVMAGEVKAYSDEYWKYDQIIYDLAHEIIELEDRYNESI